MSQENTKGVRKSDLDPPAYHTSNHSVGRPLPGTCVRAYQRKKVMQSYELFRWEEKSQTVSNHVFFLGAKVETFRH